MQIRNKVTGEVIDLSSSQIKPEETNASKPGDYSGEVKQRQIQAEERIAERGTIQGAIQKDLASKSTVGNIKAGLEVASAPLNAIESAIANPALEIQKGNINPGSLINSAIKGATLQRQGQYGDVFKIAGTQPQVADIAGMVLNMTPLKVAQMANKSLGTISKLSDKTIKSAGNSLLDAVSESKRAAGTKVQQAFQPYDRTPVDGIKFLDAFTKLPNVVQRKAESLYGKVKDFSQTLTIGRLRDFKRFLGKVNPGAYGKEARGIAENIEVLDLNSAYSGIKKLLQETLTNNLDAKTAKYLMDAEESFSKVILAGRYIRHNITNSILLAPTKAGELAKSVASKTADISSREALNTIKFTSKEAMKHINRAMTAIDKYNRWERNKQIASHLGKAAFYGGVVAAAGSRIARSIAEKNIGE